MKLKSRAADFRVRELLAPEVLQKKGEFRIYRVIKRKLTSLEAAEVLAQEAGRGAGEIAMCGLKDRQGVTTQYMSIRHGPEVSAAGSDVKIETIGFAAKELDSKDSTGNAFELVVRDLHTEELAALRTNLARIRKQGVINYFDEQRFGNLRHGQGWIALDLMKGQAERALKMLLAARSLHDDPRTKVLKQALWENWGDWSACRDIAGKLGAHHSVFEHLRRHPDDFAGAFYHVSSRVRLIHLYAYQSHVWNRAVADFVREHVPVDKRVVLESEEGPLVYPAERDLLPVAPDATFRLPGPGLEDVIDPVQRGLLADVLAGDRLAPGQFQIEGVSGMALKGEDRPLFVHPAHLRVRPPKADPHHRNAAMVGVRFELPRGAYATLVARRLFEVPGRAPQSLAEVQGRELAEESGEPLEGRPQRRSPRPEGREERAPRAGARRFDGPPPRRGPRDERGFDGPPRRGPRDDRDGPPRRGPRAERGFDGPPPRGPRFERGFDGPPRRGPRDDREGPPRRFVGDEGGAPPWRERRGPPRGPERGFDGPPRRPRPGPGRGPRDDGPAPRPPRRPR